MLMSMVHTTKGMIDRHRLVVTDVVSDEDNARVTATEWHLDGELVRRDVNVNILQGQAVFGDQAEV